MNRNFLQNNQNGKPYPLDEIKRANALSVLKEALFFEEYEKCAQLTRIAKNFGASQEEIATILDEHVRGARNSPQNKEENVSRY